MAKINAPIQATTTEYRDRGFLQGCIGSSVCGRLAVRRKFQKSAGKCTTCPTPERSVVSTTRPSLSTRYVRVFRGRTSRDGCAALRRSYGSREPGKNPAAIESHPPLISTQSSPNGRRFDQGSTCCIRVVRQRRVSMSSSSSRAATSRSEKPHTSPGGRFRGQGWSRQIRRRSLCGSPAE